MKTCLVVNKSFTKQLLQSGLKKRVSIQRIQVKCESLRKRMNHFQNKCFVRTNSICMFIKVNFFKIVFSTNQTSLNSSYKKVNVLISNQATLVSHFGCALS